MTTYTHITVERSFQDKIATVTMRRPEVHNALNAQLIADLQAAFTDLSTDERLHAVVLTGEGRSFSTGADINMMAESAARWMATLASTPGVAQERTNLTV